MLTNEHIEQFKLDGYTIIEDILSQEQVDLTRINLHDLLKNKCGIDHDNIINFIDSPPENSRIKSNVANIFYSKFKLDIQINESMYLIWKELIEKTINEYPLGPHDDVIPYIDRICYRLPDVIREEGGLDLHLDRRPGENFLSNVKKYRPIQGFVSLTDHYGENSGGLRLVKGFHKQFDGFFSKDFNKNNWENSGDFFRMHSKSYAKIQNQLETLNIPAGSLVLWDNRLPHATCQKLKGCDSREVIYLSYIPNVPLNIKYAQEQKANFKLNLQPPSYLTGTNLFVDRDYLIEDLTKFQKKFLS
jgi:ectoine hydroxylase-related dioxygenase (phytanoyl-CoA dioxygenase family)